MNTIKLICVKMAAIIFWVSVVILSALFAIAYQSIISISVCVKRLRSKWKFSGPQRSKLTMSISHERTEHAP